MALAYGASVYDSKPPKKEKKASSYSKYVKYFGSAKAYADAIKAKEKAGKSLSDRAAAEAFKKAHPEYFRSTSSSLSRSKRSRLSAQEASAMLRQSVRSGGTGRQSILGTLDRSRFAGTNKTSVADVVRKAVNKYTEKGPLGIPLPKPEVAATLGELAFGGGVVKGATAPASAIIRGALTRGAGRTVIPRVTQAVSRTVSPAAGTAIRTAASGAGAAIRTAASGVGSAVKNLPKPVKVGVPVVAAGGAAYSALKPGGGAGTPDVQNPPVTVDHQTQSTITGQSGTPGGGMTPNVPGTPGGGNQMTTTPPAGMTGMTGGTQFTPTVHGPPDFTPPVPPEQPEMPQYPPVDQYISEMYDIINQFDPQVAAGYYTALMNYLDLVQGQLQDMFNQIGQGIDPATQAALARIRESVAQERARLMEDLNRRGILRSGIAAQELANLFFNKQLSAEEELLANRLADIQNRMIDSLMSFAQMRANAMGEQARNMMNLQQWKTEALTDLGRWAAERAEQARQQAEEQRRWEYEQQLERARQIADWTGRIPEGWPGAGQPTWQARQDQMGSTNSSLTNQYIQQVPTYNSLEEALAEYNRYLPIMQAQGVDTQAVLNAIYGYFGRR